MTEISGYAKITLLVMTLFLACLCATNSAAEAKLEQLVVFGDGYSDTGNAYNRSLSETGVGTPQSPLYFDGRASNGPVWVEHLAVSLGLPLPEPVLVGGSNYAWYGAAVAADGSADGAQGIAAQVDTYLAYGNRPDSTQLIVIWAGLGDFVNSTQQRVAVPDPTDMVNEIASQISRLADATAPDTQLKVLVANLPLLGQTTHGRWLGIANPQLPDLLDRLSLQVNALLSGQLKLLARSRDIEIIELDVFGLDREIAADPAVFGFSNVTDPAMALRHAGGDASDHVFYDDLYPTTRWHEIVAERALRQLKTDSD